MTSVEARLTAVTDPGFSRGGGANPKGVGAKLLFWPIFPTNCTKIKTFGPRGGGRYVPGVPLGSANE